MALLTLDDLIKYEQLRLDEVNFYWCTLTTKTNVRQSSSDMVIGTIRWIKGKRVWSNYLSDRGIYYRLNI